MMDIPVKEASYFGSQKSLDAAGTCSLEVQDTFTMQRQCNAYKDKTLYVCGFFFGGGGEEWANGIPFPELIARVNFSVIFVCKLHIFIFISRATIPISTKIGTKYFSGKRD